MAVNNVLVPGSNGQTPALIADRVLSYPATPGQPASGPGGVATFTTATVGGVQVPVSAALELQSTTGGFIMPRMTAAQRLLLVPTNGMEVYELDTQAVWWYLNGTWVQVDPTSGGGGGVNGVAPTVLNSVALWNNTLATSIKGSLVTFIVNGTDAAADDIAHVATILASKTAGLIGSPNYSFTGDANTGMWSSAAETLDFSTNGARQFQIVNSAGTNWATITGAATNNAPALSATGGDANVSLTFHTKGTGAFGFLTNSGAAPQVEILNTASSVNALTFTGSATTNAVTIGTTGSDANISINVVPKGTTGALLNVSGLIATPSYSFAGNINTGMWSSGANIIDFSANGTRALQLTSLSGSADEFIRISDQVGNGGAVISAASSTPGNAVNIILTPQNVSGAANQSAVTITKGTGATTGSGILFFLNSGGTGGVGLTCQDAATSDTIWKLPLVDGTAGQGLVTNGLGVLSFANTGGGIQSISGTIANGPAQAAYTTPISLIPAAGANTMIIVERITWEFVGGTPFVGSGDFIAEYGSVAHGTGAAACGSVLNASFVGLGASTILFSNPTVASIPVAANTNLGVFLSATGGANFTGGGALNYTIQYYVITVT